MQVMKHLEGHYELQEVPFGRIYEWCPESVVVECDCGQRSILKVSALSGCGALCACGADLATVIQENLEGHQPEVQGQMLSDYEAVHHPWLYDTRAQGAQHLRDEAAYPEDSPWRYNDITSRGSAHERDVQ
jgi:hypothetical protein